MRLMNITAPPLFAKVAQAKNSTYQAVFNQFEYFTNYIYFAFEFLTPEIWVDTENEPTLACFYAIPQNSLLGCTENN